MNGNRLKDYRNEYKSVIEDEDKSHIFKLEKFEGPLDLLLYLIRKSEVDVYDIPIHEITEQYLQYISLMKKLDINLAAEFIIMAANLIYIKSKTLLPVQSDIEEEYFEDPRTELVQQLLEYQKFKNASLDMEDLKNTQSHIFFRPKNQIVFDFEDTENWVDINLFDLINIFNKLLSETGTEKNEYIMPETITVSMKIEEILLKLDYESEIAFSALFDANHKLWELIVTFLAILELVKQKFIFVKQHKLFGDIKILKREETDGNSKNKE
ncbi:MAG: segregation/condensation protein A [Spirochaetes bacterium]|nr:segregation/condensation protein A [Spirochaetota bacterium]